MYDVTELIDSGRYYEVFELDRTADPDTLDARIAEVTPRHAAERDRLDGIAAVLRDPGRREVYDIARDWLERLLRDTFSDAMQKTSPGLRRQAWYEVQRVLRCDFPRGSVGLGPRGARSLTVHDEWVREAVVNVFVPIVPSTDAQGGYLHRRVTFPDECERCRAAGARPCAHDYKFLLPADARPGRVIAASCRYMGPDQRLETDRVGFIQLDRTVVTPRPEIALNAMYVFAQSEWSPRDLTFAEAKAFGRRSGVGFVLAYLGIAGLLGLLLGSVTVALVAVVPTAVCWLVASARGFGVRSAGFRYGIAAALAVSFPLVGTLAGAVLASPATGAIIGAVCGIPYLAVLLLGAGYNRCLRRCA